MCEPAIHVLKSVFTRLVRQNAFVSVATLRVAVLFFCVSTIVWVRPPVKRVFCRLLYNIVPKPKLNKKFVTSKSMAMGQSW